MLLFFESKALIFFFILRVLFKQKYGTRRWWLFFSVTVRKLINKKVIIKTRTVQKYIIRLGDENEFVFELLERQIIYFILRVYAYHSKIFLDKNSHYLNVLKCFHFHCLKSHCSFRLLIIWNICILPIWLFFFFTYPSYII